MAHQGRRHHPFQQQICRSTHHRPPSCPDYVQCPWTWVQGHWAIETKLHWVRDVVYAEDRSTGCTGNAPRVMATLRSTAISLLRLTGINDIATATRHHARDATRPAKLLLTCSNTALPRPSLPRQVR
jgi:hypothetical protein